MRILVVGSSTSETTVKNQDTPLKPGIVFDCPCQ
jgi:hypothetical protein